MEVATHQIVVNIPQEDLGEISEEYLTDLLQDKGIADVVIEDHEIGPMSAGKVEITVHYKPRKQ